MTETLTIRNFGPIKDKGVTIELREVNIFIGDQGTGKSTVAKLLSAIKVTLLETYIDNKNTSFNVQGKPATKEEFKQQWLNDFVDRLEFFGVASYLDDNTFVRFEDADFLFEYSEHAVTIKEVNHGDEKKHKSTPLDIYIPSYREVAVLLKDKLYAVLQAKATLPDILTTFGIRFIEARKQPSGFNYSDVLGVSYFYKNEKDFVKLNDGSEVLIENASSAINSGIPMLVVFDNEVNEVVSHDIDSNLYTPVPGVRYANVCPYIIIEEPEINCFPETQDKLMKHFISKIKSSTFSHYFNRLLVTTHSPYILSSLNNLISAHNAGRFDAKNTSEVIPEKYWLNPDDVSAYMMLQDGTCEDIMDRDENMIKAEKIDGISGILNEQFDKLLGIEFEHKK